MIILGEREFWQTTATRPTATGWHLHVQRLWFYGSDEIGFTTAVCHEKTEQLIHRSHEHALSHGFGQKVGSGHQDCAISSHCDDLFGQKTHNTYIK